MKTITQFRGAHHFLSNFFPCPILYDERIWPTAEHAYQAAKTDNEVSKEMIHRALDPGRAKFLGQNVLLKNDWDSQRRSVMLEILRAKFRRNHELARLLLDTGDAILVEGNAWGDRYWGQVRVGDRWVGENWLGKLLMDRRSELQTAPTMFEVAEEKERLRR